MAYRTLDGDPAITSELIAEITPGRQRDGLIERLVEQIPEDPERAIQWASVVSDPVTRERLARNVLDHYWEATPEILKGAINQSLLTDAEKDLLMGHVCERRRAGMKKAILVFLTLLMPVVGWLAKELRHPAEAKSENDYHSIKEAHSENDTLNTSRWSNIEVSTQCIDPATSAYR